VHLAFIIRKALAAAGRDGLVWDEARITQLISDPAKFLNGAHRMRATKRSSIPRSASKLVAALKSATR
jgi:cytochrome c2